MKSENDQKVFVIGDIHGGDLALKQCLERCNFNFEKDVLISLGDIVDGWSRVYECVELLLKVKNLIAIKGNHDEWFTDFIDFGNHPGLNQGGKATLISYCRALNKDWIDNYGIFNTSLLPEDIPVQHQLFFKNQLLYYKDEENRFFVHGGFNRHHSIEMIEKIEPHSFYWDRDLWLAALSYGNIDIKYKFKIKDNFSEIFIGHTTTMNWKTDQPMKAANIWNLDTGAGFKGRLTIMNVDTKEYYQSDLVQELYPDEKGRN